MTDEPSGRDGASMKARRWMPGEWAAVGLLLLVWAAVGEGDEPTRARLVEVAREIMQSARFCALVTLDESGRPQARAMDPFAPQEDLVVWLATNPKSRKVQQIRNDSRVTLYYFDADSSSYVTLLGEGHLVDDAEEKARRWKDGWEAFYPDREESYLLIRIVPRRLEVVSERHGIGGDPETWTPLSVGFATAESSDRGD